jgi:hypothetical protein
MRREFSSDACILVVSVLLVALPPFLPSRARERLTEKLLAREGHNTRDAVLGRLPLPFYSARAFAHTTGAGGS